jgi:hypothetical protein
LAPDGAFGVDDDDEDVIEAAAIEAARELAEGPSENDGASNSHCAPLAKNDADGQGNDAPADAALDTLIEQARSDPELAARIRRRVASLD